MLLLSHSQHHHALGSFSLLTTKEFYLGYKTGVSFSSTPHPVIGILACSYLQFFTSSSLNLQGNLSKGDPAIVEVFCLLLIPAAAERQ